MERLVYKIYPDGRIEERVEGVKGKDCLKITEDIHQQLGNVISSAPTEEMYEEPVKIQNRVELNEGGGGDGDWSTSW